MAHKRMFSKDITGSDAFRDMPSSSQLLYFHLGMEADDDGFIGAYKTIQRGTGASDDDFKILLAKRFLIQFESGVIVVKHWLINNTIRKDRYNETKYLEEKKSLYLKDNLSYSDDKSNGIPLRNQSGIPKLYTQDRIEEKRRDSVATAPRIVEVVTEGKKDPKNSPDMLEGYKIFSDNPAYVVWPQRSIERDAMRALIEAYGLPTLEERYAVAKKYRGQDMCPFINSPLTFLEKMGQMENFLNKL